MAINAVLFDLDGLLIDSESLHFLSWQETLAGVDVPLDEATYFDHWTRAGRGIAEFCAQRNLPHDLSELRRSKARTYEQRVHRDLSLMPGALECLDRLDGHKRLALVTAGYPDAVRPALAKFDLHKYFDPIVTRHNVKRVKPAPDAFLHAAQLLGVSAKDCVVIEDAEKGVLAAHAAGIPCIAVPNRFTRGNDFSRATLVIDSLHDLTVQKIDAICL